MNGATEVLTLAFIAGSNMGMVLIMRKLRALSLALLFLVLLAPRCVTAQISPIRPNIILILANDLGYGDLGCYGQQRIKTPNLDQLAADGMRFTSFYAGSTVSDASRGCLLTGQHTGHAWIRGTINGQAALRPNEVTVAEILKKCDYRTGAVGEWGLGAEGSAGTPNAQGFDEWIGTLTDAEASSHFPARINRNGSALFFEQNLKNARGLYCEDLYLNSALNFLRINAPDRSQTNRHFFLYFASPIAHPNTTDGTVEIPSDAPYSNEPWPQAEKNKAAMITRLDADIGQILEKLKQLKASENTIVLFTSSNGPHRDAGIDPRFQNSAGPLRGAKGTLYEGGIRVPLIVRWPGHVKPGSVSDFPSAFWDILPTLAALCSMDSLTKIDGFSLLPTLTGHNQQPHKQLYWETHETGFQQAARMGQWKAIRNGPEKPIELYNLDEDAGEKFSVAGEHPRMIALFEELFKQERTESELWPTTKKADQKK